MARGEDRIHRCNGHWYIPFNIAGLAAGIFLSWSPNWVEEHLELPPGFLVDRFVGGVGMRRAGLAAARVHGDSMIDVDVYDGDIAIFQRHSFPDPKNGAIMVVEKVGEEEGFGAWALKKLVIERPRSSHRSEYEDEIDWDDPVVVLRSYNPRISPSQLDPSGQYRLHGIFRRSMRPYEATLVDSDLIRQLATREE
jgi:Peptidase S24-like